MSTTRTATAKPTPIAHGQLWGVAARYGFRSPGTCDILDEASRHLAGSHLRFAAGCFAATLAAVRAGKAQVRLLLDHDFGRELASTADNSLILADGPTFLTWRANPATRRGRAAIAAAARLRHHRECSVGSYLTVFAHEKLPSGSATLHASKAVLREISLVPFGAFRDSAKAFVTAAAPGKPAVRPAPAARPVATPIAPPRRREVAAMSANQTTQDHALLDLARAREARGPMLRGVQGPPPGVMAALKTRGLVAVRGGRYELTAAGYRRAAELRGAGGGGSPDHVRGGGGYRPTILA